MARIRITDEEKEKMIKELIKVGCVRRKEGSPYVGGSIGEKGKPALKIWI